MYTINVNNKFKSKIEKVNNTWLANDKEINLDLIKVKEGSYHIILNHQSYSVEVLKFDAQEKLLSLKVNGNKYNVQVKDKYDELLHSLGLDTLAVKKVNDIKAPMPGLVLKIMVEEGAEVKKGDPLIVLEAMKMENILKSPHDGVVKKIAVKKGVAVEKNQVLINF